MASVLFTIPLQLIRLTAKFPGGIYSCEVIDPVSLAVIDHNNARDISGNGAEVGEYYWAGYVGSPCINLCFNFITPPRLNPCCTVTFLTHTIDALVFDHESTLQHTIDAALFQTVPRLTHTIDALVFDHESTLQHTIDAALFQTVPRLTHTIDALVFDAESTLTHTIDALVFDAESTLTHTIDALVFDAESTLNHTIDADIEAPPGGSSDDRFPTVANGNGAWGTPDNIKVQDGSYATLFAAGVPSAELEGSTFGFSLPGGATIDGIEVVVRIKESTSAIKLNHVVIKGGFGTSSDLGTSAEIATSDTDYTFGSPSSLAVWGVSPSVANVNASGFTVAIGVQAISGMGPQASVDCIHCKVYYH